MSLFSKKEVKPQHINVKGKKLKCTICAHDRFYYRKAQLNTKIASLLDVDWANKSAHCYVCENCTHIEWFLEQK